MFLFRKTPLVVDFFTDYLDMPEVTRPDMAVRFMPEWWLNIPKNAQAEGQLFPDITMRKCAGFIDYFSNSVMVPLWSDFVVEVGPVGTVDYQFQFADRRSVGMEHPQVQRGAYLPPNQYQHMKLDGQWMVSTKDETKWVLSQPTWCFDSPENVIIPPGIAEFKHQHHLNVSMFIPRPTDGVRRILLGAGQPLLAMTPMTDKKVVVKTHQVTRHEMDKLNSKTVFFSGDYLKKRAMRAAAKTKCPFGFK
jgi:hypothetical protein